MYFDILGVYAESLILIFRITRSRLHRPVNAFCFLPVNLFLDSSVYKRLHPIYFRFFGQTFL